METSLFDILATRLRAAQRTRLAHIDTENFSLVIKRLRNVMAQEGILLTPEYLNQAILALKQYYAVVVLDPTNSHAASPLVTQLLGMHQLYTTSYDAFCTKITGGPSLSFERIDPHNASMVQNVIKMYRYTLDVLPLVFRWRSINAEIWPTDIPEDPHLTCYHKGNRKRSALQRGRLFEPLLTSSFWAVSI